MTLPLDLLLGLGCVLWGLLGLARRRARVRVLLLRKRDKEKL